MCSTNLEVDTVKIPIQFEKHVTLLFHFSLINFWVLRVIPGNPGQTLTPLEQDPDLNHLQWRR